MSNPLTAKQRTLVLPETLVIAYAIPARRSFDKEVYERPEFLSKDKDNDGNLKPITNTDRLMSFEVEVDVALDTELNGVPTSDIVLELLKDRCQYKHFGAQTQEDWERMQVGDVIKRKLSDLITPKTRTKRESIETQIKHLRELVASGDMSKADARKKAKALKEEAIQREMDRLEKLQGQDVSI